jgi:hypothetical protein
MTTILRMPHHGHRMGDKVHSTSRKLCTAVLRNIMELVLLSLITPVMSSPTPI